MALGKNELRAELTQRVQAMRWEHHRWFKKLFAKELTKDHCRFWHEQQFYITGQAQELVAPLYLKCPFPEVRVQILRNLLEEETGCETKTAPHPELFIRLGLALGNTRERYMDIKPLPETAALRHYWDWLGHQRSFLEGLAGIAVAGEGQMPNMGSRVSEALEKQFGLTHDESAAWWAHDEADKEHSGTALEVVVERARTDQEQKQVLRAVDLSLELMWLFFSGLYRYCIDDRKLP
jgi:pyrroloquinoline-quinone synthase